MEASSARTIGRSIQMLGFSKLTSHLNCHQDSGESGLLRRWPGNAETVCYKINYATPPEGLWAAPLPAIPLLFYVKKKVNRPPARD